MKTPPPIQLPKNTSVHWRITFKRVKPLICSIWLKAANIKDAKLAIKCSFDRKTNIKIADKITVIFADSSFNNM